ncbi:hypothetical protein TWF481_000042 [Arthrobotrys musiformis]|uniref:Uncharacterized protein n=1 Tax=Arthrobotrys musiformis TaxID=47236 RepID=A0AAV9WN20_9PEZI
MDTDPVYVSMYVPLFNSGVRNFEIKTIIINRRQIHTIHPTKAITATPHATRTLQKCICQPSAAHKAAATRPSIASPESDDVGPANGPGRTTNQGFRSHHQEKQRQDPSRQVDF